MAGKSARRQRKTRSSIMRRVRAMKSVDTYVGSPSLSSKPNNEEQNVSTDDAGDLYNCYSIIQMKSLLSLMKQTLCSCCRNPWDGSLSIGRRDGLYVHLEFTCSSCENVTHLHSSPKLQDSGRHEVNTRLAIGGTLSGIGRSGVEKLLGAMNLPPPVKEEYDSKTQGYLIDHVVKAQEESMNAAVGETILESGGNTELTVSGDGAWLTRGYRSAHGIATLCSVTPRPKILDANWLSKRCSKCQGIGSIRHQDPELFQMYSQLHNCQVNYEGKCV